MTDELGTRLALAETTFVLLNLQALNIQYYTHKRRPEKTGCGESGLVPSHVYNQIPL